MSDVNLTPTVNEEMAPTLEELKELYSHQHRDCWMCAEAFKTVEAGKTLKDEQLWHFTNCVLSWEQLHTESAASESVEQIEKAA